jgi:hypothetical protein
MIALNDPEEIMSQATPQGNGERKLQNDPERRRSLRIAVPFPVRVRGISPTGKRLEFETEIDNLGAGGLLLHSAHDIRNWRNLTMVMQLSLVADSAAPAPIVAARVKILRTEPKGERCAAYAVAFTRRRFV